LSTQVSKPNIKDTRRRYNTGTPDMLLDAAEYLFSIMDFEATTLADIAKQAGANVGQIVYHFGTKEALLRACILRRAKTLSLQRRKLLENYQQLVGKKDMQIEPLIRAFMDPFFKLVLENEDGGHNYARLLARFVWRENATEILSEGFDEVAKLYLESFHQALPGLDEDGAARGFQFMLGAIYSSVAGDKRIEILTDGASKARDHQAYYDVLIPFVAAGFSRLAEIK